MDVVADVRTDGRTPLSIPGVAYFYAPSDNFHMNIGLPFSMMYRPIDRLTLEASYMPIHTIHAKAKYKNHRLAFRLRRLRLGERFLRPG